MIPLRVMGAALLPTVGFVGCTASSPNPPRTVEPSVNGASPTPPGHPTAVPEPPGPTTTRYRVDSIHVALGVPVDADPPDDMVIDKAYFVSSYNNDRKDPNWVLQRLT
jgi:hypothetical protein